MSSVLANRNYSMEEDLYVSELTYTFNLLLTREALAITRETKLARIRILQGTPMLVVRDSCKYDMLARFRQ